MILNKYIQFFDRSIAWTLFRSLSNAQIMRSTILIPILGYWILFNEKLLPYFELSGGAFSNGFSNGFSIGEEPKISVHLLQVYFGLCLIAFGSILYQFSCPREIKRYGSSEEYISGDKENVSSIELDRIQKSLSEDIGYKDLLKMAGQNHFSQSNNTIKAVFKREILYLNYGKLNQKYFIFRFSILILYILGFYYLSKPSIEVFSKVFSLLFFQN